MSNSNDFIPTQAANQNQASGKIIDLHRPHVASRRLKRRTRRDLRAA
ncbi:hypothetical protein MNBD_ALPHA06-1367 [hydrothermal vent metagenome]|uniref:Uncharacterized protein n=1 Tax=hydrothermal vent metagenome TaxID=652676 RepID=A0A3B0R5J1_9ZZZZ